jgi:hypothetical protein
MTCAGERCAGVHVCLMGGACMLICAIAMLCLCACCETFALLLACVWAGVSDFACC